MICPKCKSGNVSVIDSRPQESGHRRRRYRRNNCDRRFYTIETYAEEVRRHTEQIVDYIINDAGELDYRDNHGELIRRRECQERKAGANDAESWSYCGKTGYNVDPDDYCSRARKVK